MSLPSDVERVLKAVPVQRLTSAEIAGRLFINHRTVEGHLASVYVKLGVNSKPDLAQRLADLGL